jgi:galactosyl transferase GMA12/MNN10 family
MITVLCVYVGQRILSFYEQHRVWTHPPYHFIERTCSKPNYYTYTDAYNNKHYDPIKPTINVQKPKICITTLTDERNKSFLNRILGWRNFDGILDLTIDNKVQYANKHKYVVYDESHVVNGTRGPSWFKIIAVQRLLREENCDWVFWMDADIVIMNSTIMIEDFLPYYSTTNINQQQPQYDLLLSIDNPRGSSSRNAGTMLSNGIANNTNNYGTGNTGSYNAGAWLIRNSEWSREFLTTWWNMKSYVMPIGQSFSGDNHALNDLLHSIPNFDDHCVAPPRCTFNSFAKFVEKQQDQTATLNELMSERFMNEGYYHMGDFVSHVAGVDNKRDTIKMLLEIAQ